MKEDKVSKLTKVLINDLKGRRIVTHNFHEQNNRTLGGDIADQQKRQKGRKNKLWWKKITSWEAITGLIILALLSLVATTFYSIFRKPKRSTEKIT